MLNSKFIQQFFNQLNSRPVDVEYVALYHNVYSEDINGHLYRGYTILPSERVFEASIKEIVPFSGVKRPIWYVLPGLGPQWPGMGNFNKYIIEFAPLSKKLKRNSIPTSLVEH